MIRHNRVRMVIYSLVLSVSVMLVLMSSNDVSARINVAVEPPLARARGEAAEALNLSNLLLLTDGSPRPAAELTENVVPGSAFVATHNHVQADFSGSISKSGETPRYQYRLEDSGEEWSLPTARPAVSYAGLKPGTYRLLVRAVASDGTFSPTPTSVAFRILPPVWRQWWFITIVGILAGCAIITFEQFRAARMKELNAALSESEELTERLTIQQAELGKANRTLALDYAVTRALVESATPVEAALRVLQTICISTGWDVGAIWDVEPQSHVARCVGVWKKPMTGAVEFEALGRDHFFSHDKGLPARVLASRQPRWVTDIVESDCFPRLTIAARGGLRSGFGFPILVGSDVIGVLEFYSREFRHAEQELIEIMSTIGSHIGQLIQRKRAEDALIRSKEERLLELQRVRRRIATDLHDDVGSSLTKIALLSEAVRQKVAGKDKDACERLGAVMTVSNELVETMSDIVWAINPQKDRLSDLSQRMRRFASDIFTACKTSFRFNTPGAESDIQLGANVRREVFLIFKESVNNVVKHSRCSEVTLNLSVEDGWLCLSIIDNGRGIDPHIVKADTGYLTSQMRGGNGLSSMRRRARELGGEFDIITGKGRGTAISLRLPVCG